MQLEDIHQESLGNIIGGTPEVLAYNLQEAHARGYFDNAVTLGDVCCAYVSYLVDMLAGHGIPLQLKGPITSVADECDPQ